MNILTKINLLSKNKKAENIPIRIIINSFSGNSKESDQSEEILNYFHSKNIHIQEILDINQELIFDKEKSKLFF